ncbi:hypothetical protein V6N12_069246 [Hibiscus sabdariffa]|uniref:Uncharacterized protein n=1 Tax=Hibiscus sabdariffa TaxID=183260 RepID=A0ABR2FDF2_9ROSI
MNAVHVRNQKHELTLPRNRPGSILVQPYPYSMPYSASSSQRPYRYGPSRIGTICLIQIPVAKDRIGTGQTYRYGMPELHTLV